MKSIKFLILATLFLAVLSLTSPLCVTVKAAEIKHSSTEADRSSVTLTIYSSGGGPCRRHKGD